MAATSDGVRLRQFITSLVDDSVLARGDFASGDSNPLASVNDQEKEVLLTLYAAFPKELPFALDLLDRHLIHRLCPTQSRHEQHQGQDEATEHSGGSTTLEVDANGPVKHDHSSEQAEAVDEDATDVEVSGQSTHADQLQPLNGLETPSEARETLAKSTTPKDATPVFYVRSAQHNVRSRYRDDNPVHHEVRLAAWSCSCPAFSISAFPAGRPTEETDQDSHGADKVNGTFGGVSLSGSPPVCKHLLACYLAYRMPQLKPFIAERSVSSAEVSGWAAGWGD